jgi:hypothetical protein
MRERSFSHTLRSIRRHQRRARREGRSLRGQNGQGTFLVPFRGDPLHCPCADLVFQTPFSPFGNRGQGYHNDARRTVHDISSALSECRASAVVQQQSLNHPETTTVAQPRGSPIPPFIFKFLRRAQVAGTFNGCLKPAPANPRRSSLRRRQPSLQGTAVKCLILRSFQFGRQAHPVRGRGRDNDHGGRDRHASVELSPRRHVRGSRPILAGQQDGPQHL